jgi:hypothetical protein
MSPARSPADAGELELIEKTEVNGVLPDFVRGKKGRGLSTMPFVAKNDFSFSAWLARFLVSSNKPD